MQPLRALLRIATAWLDPLIVVTVACAIFTATAGAQTTDIIRGRIVGPDSQALQGVRVKVTSYAGAVEKSATTDKSGRFTVAFINGEGDYWIDLNKIGYTAKRFEVRKIGDEEVLLANARMSNAQPLSAIEITAQRRELVKSGATDADIGGGDKSLAATNIAADQAGNLSAMAASVAGFQIIPGLDGASDMFSLLGLSGDQNNTTFQGLGSGVSALPPDILVTTSIRPFPFDVSIGGFSGAQISIQSIPGTNFSRRSITTVGITPPLEWGNATALAQGQKYTNVRVGGNAAGPISQDRAFYNSAYNVGRQFSDLQTLLNTNAIGLAAAGVAEDSASRLVSILQSQNIPFNRSEAPGDRARDFAQLTGNIDLMPSASGTGHSFTIGGAGNYQRTEPISRGGLLLTTPSHSGETSFWGANASVVHSNYFWFGIFSKTTLGFAAQGQSTSPYESIPEGLVRVNSTLPDGSTSVKPLYFGGSSTQSTLNTETVQLTNQLTWFSLDNKHSFKATASVMRDAFHSDLNPSLLGTFNYNSLEDLAAQQPSSFTRTLNASTRSGNQLSGALSLGDSWRPNPGLQLQYGLRADLNHFGATPQLNSDLESTFGINNSNVPNRVYLSPRVGVQWHYGNSDEVQYAPGAARPPRAVVHAGVGVFQLTSPAQLISSAVSSTGLPNAARSINCVGVATPTADWDAFLTNPNAIPSACADGSNGSAFASSSPSVTFFDHDFRQAQSIRGAADWSGPVLNNRFVLGLQSIVSTALHQQSMVDVNLNPTVRFNLPNENGRPVFVEPTAIVPSTGALSLAASRTSSKYQQVWKTQSALKVASTQFSINLKPISANARLRWQFTYTLLDTRETFNGFSSTVGNPNTVERGQSLLPGRHVFQIAWSDFPIFDVVYLTATARLSSGQRYTPMIGGDVNGDGVLNDRAFISNASDAMQALLANTTPSVRRCLNDQINMLATRGSCQTGWTANGLFLIKFNPTKIGLPKRATVSLNVTNPMALADLALHGSRELRGWGQNIAPDQNLLFVRAFDASTREFKYDVNQRFGSTRPQQSSVYSLPFVSLQLSLDIGVSRERQLLTQALDVGRKRPGTRAAPLAMTGLGLRSIPNPMSMILAQSTALKLTREQADSLANLSKLFAAFADTTWAPVGKELAAMPGNYKTGEAFDRYSIARAKTVDYLLTIVPHAKGVLTAEQRRKLPAQVANYLDERVLKFLRTSTVGDGSAAVVRR